MISLDVIAAILDELRRLHDATHVPDWNCHGVLETDVTRQLAIRATYHSAYQTIVRHVETALRSSADSTSSRPEPSTASTDPAAAQPSFWQEAG